MFGSYKQGLQSLNQTNKNLEYFKDKMRVVNDEMFGILRHVYRVMLKMLKRNKKKSFSILIKLIRLYEYIPN